jgi:DNA-binding PadR family transcriptional regulator
MRSTLELLLLTLIRDGIETPYELKTRADISLGSAVPALARLKTDGLLKTSGPEARRSRRFELTPKGHRVLKQGWSEHLRSATTDVDSVLRIAYLCWLNGRVLDASIFLDRAADRVAGMATMAAAETTRFGRRSGEVNSDAMRWLRARVQARRIRAEAEALRDLAEELRNVSAPKERGTTKNKTKRRKQRTPRES